MISTYHAIMAKVPDELRVLVYEYVNPDNTFIYTQIEEINSILTRSLPPNLLETCTFQYLRDKLQNNTLLETMNALVLYVPQYYETAVGTSSLRESDKGVSYINYKFECNHTYLHVEKVEFVFAMILCGFMYEIKEYVEHIDAMGRLVPKSTVLLFFAKKGTSTFRKK